MSLRVKKSASAGVHIDDGEYTAIVESIQLNKWEDGNESYGWTFKIKNATLDGDPVDGIVRIRSFASALLTPKSKLFKWAKGAGLDVENEDEIDLEEAIGKTVRISVEDHETKDGAIVSKVDKVRPLKKKTKNDEDDDEEEEKPKKKNKVKPTEKKKARPVDEDDDPDDDEEEPPKKKKKGDKGEKKVEKKKTKKTEEEDDDSDDEEELFNFSEDDEDEDEE